LGAVSKFLVFVLNSRQRIFLLTIQHLYISLIAVVMGVAVAVPLGILLTRWQRLANPVIGVANVLQTIPSIALLAFMIPLLGIGKVPAIAALFLYSLLPILRNTYTGIKGVDQGVLEAGRGMGMTDLQLLYMVELPLATAVIMAGIRTATVITIGTATLAAVIGGRGLGELIFAGINMVNNNLVLAGAIPAALLAIIIDALMEILEKYAVPRGLRAGRS